MSKQESYVLLMMQKATHCIDASNKSSLLGEWSKACEFSAQAKLLLDILDTSDCHQIIQNLEASLLGCTPLSSAKSTLDTTQQLENSSTVCPNSCTLKSVNFDDVIGNQEAKESLFENVVLPMTLAKELRDQIYVGIRENIGNVLLYGPPGDALGLYHF